MLTGKEATPGDVIFGLASSGLHSNGYSLVRRIVEDGDFDYAEDAPFQPGTSLGRALLEPTKIYIKSCLAALNTGGVHGLAHITGGGLLENIPRALSDGLAATIDVSTWPLPPVFDWLAKTGAIAPHELARTFNCGIGMAVIAAEEKAGDVEAALTDAGETVFTIGAISETSGEAAVVLENIDSAFRS